MTLNELNRAFNEMEKKALEVDRKIHLCKMELVRLEREEKDVWMELRLIEAALAHMEDDI